MDPALRATEEAKGSRGSEIGSAAGTQMGPRAELLQAGAAESLQARTAESLQARTAESLQARYAASLEQALRAEGTRAPPPWMRARLPASIGASIELAAELVGALPEALAAHYLDRAPRELVEQRLRGSDPARQLLWRPLQASRLPGFCAAFDEACALLREQGIEPERVLPAPGAVRLLAAQPCALELVSGSLLASGLPLLGAGAAEREVLAAALGDELPAALADGHPAGLHARSTLGNEDVDAVLDRHLGQHLLHELLHGRAPSGLNLDARSGDRTDPNHLAPPWLIREAAALWLQARAYPRHVFPEIAGEAIPGVSLFVLAGEGLAAALGADVLLSALADPDGWAARIGPGTAALFAAAEWQEWLQRQRAPFAQDALRARSWSKLAAASKTLSRSATHGALRPLQDVAAQLEQRPFAQAVRELPSILNLADAIPWSALPAWSAAPAPDDERRARLAIDALFQENALAPIFVTRPAALIDGTLWLDVERCELRASPRPRGVFGEPARWTFPPALCRQLHERGARALEIRGVTRDHRESLAAALVAFARDRHTASNADAELSAQLVFTCDPEGRWTSSPR